MVIEASFQENNVGSNENGGDGVGGSVMGENDGERGHNRGRADDTDSNIERRTASGIQRRDSGDCEAMLVDDENIDGRLNGVSEPNMSES